MHTAVPVPGDVVWIRQRRWRVERARRDRNVIRLDVRSRDERLTFLAPFDRPATIARTERLTRVRAGHAAARLAHLLSGTFTRATLVVAVTLRIYISAARIMPASTATVRSANTVKRNVMSQTEMSAQLSLRMSGISDHSPML